MRVSLVLQAECETQKKECRMRHSYLAQAPIILISSVRERKCKKVTQRHSSSSSRLFSICPVPVPVSCLTSLFSYYRLTQEAPPTVPL
jgi:hypothetical protein